MARSLIGCALIALLPFGASALTMEMVTVGDPENAADSSDGDDLTAGIQNFGAVGYAYQIGKFEVRNSEYVEFLNAVADTDTYGLYDPGMNSDANGGIIQSGSSGSFTYAVKPGYGNMPVVYISYYDAVRFANWIDNGQPTGAQGAGTTETGCYTLFTSGSNTINVSARRAGATWVIPNEDEWYKAAYYDPTAAGTSNYWLYPMRTDSVPYSDQPPGTSSPDSSMAGNFYLNDHLDNGYNDGWAKTGTTGPYTNLLTDVGAYTLAGSYYGTFDQGGNAYEWNETIDISATCQRGGSFPWAENSLRSSSRVDDIVPWYGDSIMGFRVAAIPRVPSLVARSMTNGAVCLELKGSVGLGHIIDVSDNLTNWQPWAVVTLPAGGWATNFVAEPDAPRRFWRARLGELPPGFVLIPAGSFQMGDSLAEGWEEESPVHTVSVSALYMQSTETTKAQWDEVWTWASTRGYTDLPLGGGKASDHPVQTVTWYAVVKWCNARSEKEGLTPCYTVGGATYKTGSSAPACNFSANGYRLPTEAEWEKAARGGSSGHRFPWSDADTITHSRANYSSSTNYVYDVSPTRGDHPAFATGVNPYTSPAGYFAANGYGLYDMAGNVWEWC